MPNDSQKKPAAAQKRPLTGLLRKAVHLDDAKPLGLRAAFAQPPDKNDVAAHVRSEIGARWSEFDKFFGLDSRAADIWKQRAKAINEREFGIRSDDPRWWESLAYYLAFRYVPGFSIKGANEKKHGAPLEWTDERLAQLFADVEHLRSKTGKSVAAICKSLPRSKDYAGRWGRHGGAALRKAYTQAKKRRRNLPFEIFLCGADATIPSNGIDPINAAIGRHALNPF